MTNTFPGSCLCGSVRYEIEGEFDSFYLCHCEYCRKDTGSAHAANLFASNAHLKWISGEEKLTVFNLPSTRHAKCFCVICGSAMPLRQNESLLAVPAGSLDVGVPIRPNAHIFAGSRADWDSGLHEIAVFDKFLADQK